MAGRLQRRYRQKRKAESIRVWSVESGVWRQAGSSSDSGLQTPNSRLFLPSEATTMSDEKNNVSRRDALKGIAGIGVSLPVLNSNLLAQEHQHGNHAQAAKPAASKTPAKAKFFSADQMALIATISELII